MRTYNWLSSDHRAAPVLDLLDALGWTIAETPEANVHATSPDGGVYVGWLPEDPSAWAREIVWRVQVLPADGEVWVQEFGIHTPPRPSPDSSRPSSPTPRADRRTTGAGRRRPVPADRPLLFFLTERH